MDWIWIWVAVVAVSLVVEFTTMEMVSLWTAIGGVVSLILSAFDVRPEIQLVVFFVVSIGLLLALRKVAIKYLLKNNNQKVGTDRIIGSSVKLLTEITPEKDGSVKVNGVIWTATIDGSETIAENTIVEIVEIRGNKFIVRKKENNS